MMDPITLELLIVYFIGFCSSIETNYKLPSTTIAMVVDWSDKSPLHSDVSVPATPRNAPANGDLPIAEPETPGDAELIYKNVSGGSQSEQLVRMMAQPGNVTSPVDADVLLPCVFDGTVGGQSLTCRWRHRGYPVVVEHRYRYVGTRGVSPKEALGFGPDCTLEIHKVQPKDSGEWRCCWKDECSPGGVVIVMQESPSTLLRGPAVRPLNSAPGFSLNPPDVTTFVNASLLLPCELTAMGDCSWKHNDIPTMMGDRYGFAVGNGTRTLNCTLRISPVHYIDAGTWQCGHLAAHLWSAQGTVQVRDAPQPPIVVVRHPTNVTALQGDQVTLDCAFNGTVNCTWQRDAHTVVIGNRYLYITPAMGNVTKDCSIRIPRVEMIDAGRFRCGRLGAILWSKEAQLVVQVPLAPRKPTISLGQLPLINPASNLVCKTEEGFPAAKAYWDLDGRRIEGAETVLPTGKNSTQGQPLLTTLLTWNQTGGWGFFNGASLLRCCVTHPGFQGLDHTEETLLKVIPHAIPPSLPEILRNNLSLSELSLQNLSTPLGQLECVTRGGNPAAQLTWVLDGKVQVGLETQEVSDGNNLFTSRLLWTTTGHTTLQQFNASKVLQCSASHPAWTTDKSRNATIYFTTNYAATNAQILWAMAPLPVDANPSVLRCTADGFPMPDYTWDFRGNTNSTWQALSSGVNVTVGGRIGYFRCTARNVLNDDRSAPPARKEVRIEVNVVALGGFAIGYIALAIYSMILTLAAVVAAILFVKGKFIFSRATPVILMTTADTIIPSPRTPKKTSRP